ncbi:hypothetical protein PAPYR_10554 [Paratrimastix pyriformis]|uniref:Uncharacterized protein n=1 Tax=Paratrimastix pyriformis TaxID=342808 RepID=A0ABQ8UAL5_9EUKA|nr:hypothetical protein PAPYR_10554 [Paratrimastix pyriformis]
MVKGRAVRAANHEVGGTAPMEAEETKAGHSASEPQPPQKDKERVALHVVGKPGFKSLVNVAPIYESKTTAVHKHKKAPPKKKKAMMKKQEMAETAAARIAKKAEESRKKVVRKARASQT